MSDDSIRESILHVLGIYPALSHSMLQIGLGTSLKAQRWKPILNEMIIEGVIARTEVVVETPSGRHRCYTKLSLGTGAGGIIRA